VGAEPRPDGSRVSASEKPETTIEPAASGDRSPASPKVAHERLRLSGGADACVLEAIRP